MNEKRLLKRIKKELVPLLEQDEEIAEICICVRHIPTQDTAISKTYRVALVTKR